MGYARTAVLLAGLTALFLVVGYLIGGQGGMMMALIFAIGMNLFAYWNSDKMVLAMYRARPADARSAPELHAIVAELAQRAGLPMPKVYLIDNDQPNAFATGRNPQNAAVAATTGLLRLLSREEVAGVIAHELSHVRHRDTLTMTIAAALSGAIGMLANFAFFFGGSRDDRNNPLGAIGVVFAALLAPLAAMLVQMAISRSREYEADRAGAEITGNPLWLASALEKLEMGSRRIANPRADANPATAHLFIVNPLRGGGIAGLFRTHPSTEDRVRRLRAMAGGLRPTGMPGATAARPQASRIPDSSAAARGPWS